MITRVCAAALAASLLFLGTAMAGPKTASLPPPDSAVAIRPGDAEYRIGPKDTLDINVFQVADLTRTAQVDTGGKIILPLVGQITAAGRTPGELSSDIAASLGKSYMKNPQVVVSVKEASSQKITVDGAVSQPGVYALTGPTTLMQAVALARGADPRLANLRRVAVIRTVQNERTTAVFDLGAIRQGKAVDPQIYGQDIIIVDTSASKSFLSNFSQAFPVLSLIPIL
ncbi:polysaccharide biosynthesis/export family protein [Caulobacter sp. DWR1-3-2b1]|uniref:polysaccharide biosynthesis/export family protein n=1 Tax=Caulobacter sp. DWR1-3-2b1 TaxID=2804670 RepID=UPI003CF1DC7C